jgi:hypothetical protein
VNLVVVGGPGWQRAHHGLSIWTRADAGVIAFDCANEGFGRSIALRTFDGRRSWFKADVTSEAAGIAGNVATAVIGVPLYIISSRLDAASELWQFQQCPVRIIPLGG